MFVLCAWVLLLTYMSVHSMHVWFSQRPKENNRCPGTGITVIVSCRMETGKLNLRPLQDQVLSTSELALLPLHGNFQTVFPGVPGLTIPGSLRFLAPAHMRLQCPEACGFRLQPAETNHLCVPAWRPCLSSSKQSQFIICPVSGAAELPR